PSAKGFSPERTALRSAPALKASPRPVRTMARTSGSSSASARSRPTRVASAALTAFFTSGRLNEITTTRPTRSKRTGEPGAPSGEPSVTVRSTATSLGASVLVRDHATQVLAGMQVAIPLVDLLEGVPVRDQLVQLQLAVSVEVGQPRNVDVRVAVAV